MTKRRYERSSIAMSRSHQHDLSRDRALSHAGFGTGGQTHCNHLVADRLSRNAAVSGIQCQQGGGKGTWSGASRTIETRRDFCDHILSGICPKQDYRSKHVSHAFFLGSRACGTSDVSRHSPWKGVGLVSMADAFWNVAFGGDAGVFERNTIFGSTGKDGRGAILADEPLDAT